MKNIFNVSSDEARRIRNLHLNESKNKKISSIINEQEIDINVDEPLKGDDTIKTDISIVEPSGEDGLEQSQMPANYHVWKWCKQGGPIVFYPPPSQPGIQGTQLQQASTTFYTMMGSPSVGEIIHITLDPSLPQRRMCYEYLGFHVRQGGQYGNLDNAATHWFAPNAVRDPGSFTSCQDCEQGGQQPIQGYCVDCVNGQMSYYPGLGNTTGCPPGYTDIGPSPNLPQGPCVECQQGNCTPVGWGYGQNHFNSMSECQQSQQCQQTEYDCVNNSCTPMPGGPFPTLADCQQSGCGTISTNTFNCVDWTSPTGCQQVMGSGGQFATLDDCLISPCQCDQWIANWPMYVNNPNYDPATPWNNFTDGPSNSNAINNQLTNVQNSNAYNSTNVTQRQKARCREKALQEWLAVATGAGACCSDQNFAVGYATNDPLGCVSQTWINQMNNFMTNHAGWPGQGCAWLNNALANAQNQQTTQGWQPGDTGYCKTQGKINFINNFKQTGNSAYVPGQAVFPLPCI